MCIDRRYAAIRRVFPGAMTHHIARLVVAVFMVGTPACGIAAQDAVDGFAARSFKAANGDTMPYRLFIPDATARTKPLPLILYLHGGGGVGHDNRKQISGGNTAGTHAWTAPDAQRQHPAFVLAPQLTGAGSPPPNGWPDVAATVTESRAMIAALRRAGSSAKYTEYPDVGHDVWTRAYAERELADWLFAQRRRR